MPADKSNLKSILTSVVILLVLTAAVVAGVILVQREQDIRNKAASGSACEHSEDCEELDSPGDSGNFSSSRNIEYIEITHQGNVRFTGTSVDENGCYSVEISGSSMSWNRLIESNVCKDIVNIQIWFTEGDDVPKTKMTK